MACVRDREARRLGKRVGAGEALRHPLLLPREQESVPGAQLGLLHDFQRKTRLHCELGLPLPLRHLEQDGLQGRKIVCRHRQGTLRPGRRGPLRRRRREAGHHKQVNSNCIHFGAIFAELYSTIDSIICRGSSPHACEYPKFGCPGSLRYPHEPINSSNFYVCEK